MMVKDLFLNKRKIAQKNVESRNISVILNGNQVKISARRVSYKIIGFTNKVNIGHLSIF